MSKNDFANLGDQIKNIVQDSLDTMNFNQLSKNIGDTVNSALNDVNRALRNQGNYRTDNIPYRDRERRQPRRPVYNNERSSHPYAMDRNRPNSRTTVVRGPRVKEVGGVSSILFTVFGSIGTGTLGLALLIVGNVAGATGMTAGLVIASGILSPFLI